jgi:hypothetical protein
VSDGAVRGFDDLVWLTTLAQCIKLNLANTDDGRRRPIERLAAFAAMRSLGPGFSSCMES